MIVPGMEFFSHSIGLSPSFSTPSADCNDQAENKIKYLEDKNCETEKQNLDVTKKKLFLKF